MEFLQTTQLAVPISQIALLLAISTLALLFGKILLALSFNYAFALYWGYILNRDILFGSNLEKIDHFNATYFGFGFAIVILALIGFFVHSE